MNVEKLEFRKMVQNMSHIKVFEEIRSNREGRAKSDDFFIHLGPLAVALAEWKLRSKKFN